jgi:hypothetical protein
MELVRTGHNFCSCRKRRLSREFLRNPVVENPRFGTRGYQGVLFAVILKRILGNPNEYVLFLLNAGMNFFAVDTDIGGRHNADLNPAWAYVYDSKLDAFADDD